MRIASFFNLLVRSLLVIFSISRCFISSAVNFFVSLAFFFAASSSFFFCFSSNAAAFIASFLTASCFSNALVNSFTDLLSCFCCTALNASFPSFDTWPKVILSPFKTPSNSSTVDLNSLADLAASPNRLSCIISFDSILFSAIALIFYNCFRTRKL